MVQGKNLETFKLNYFAKCLKLVDLFMANVNARNVKKGKNRNGH